MLSTRFEIPSLETRRAKLYGRRKGHKLRPAQAHLVETLLPDLTVPLERPVADLRDLFSGVGAVKLEVGFGAGEHLVFQAQNNPGVGFIGCEPFLNGMASLLSRIERSGVRNIRLLMGDARELLDWLPAGSLSGVYVLFADPWPKKRHHKRRFINQQVLSQLARAMAQGSQLRIATDVPDYCRWTLAHMLRHASFDWSAQRAADWRDRPPDWPETRYEAKARKAGRDCVYLTFCRTAL